ncbi:sugar phosphate isomerase/epimerase family protein [Candidatus Latescibacterota bacterium]
MTENISRRTALTTGVAMTGGIVASSCAQSTSETPSAPATPKAELSDVFGEDFLTQWGPGPDAERVTTAGLTPVRLSCTSYRLRYDRMGDIDAHIKELKALGYTAAESGDEWHQVTDSQIRELNDALKDNDFMYYTIHVFCNDIHPDPAKKEENYIRRVRSIEAAARLGLKFVVSHTGGKNTRAANSPHKDNWTKAVWDESVEAMKRLVKATEGYPVDLAVEALNPTNINNPMAHVRLKEDVGSDRIKVCLDPQNMLSPRNYYRNTELINRCFDLLGEDICYAHCKDVKWENTMLPSMSWVILGEGEVDYGTYLKRLSQLEHERPFLLEFMRPREAYVAVQKNLRAVGKEVGVNILGEQS